MSNRILVLGSTGNVGKPLVRLLREAGETVVAASRAAGPGAVRFDYGDPATFGPALAGVDRVFVVTPPGHVAADALLGPFLDAALDTVRKVVLLSAEGVQYNDEAPLRRVERRLEGSNRAYVLLRPNWFMDNFHTFWLAPMRAAGVIPVPAGESRTAFIAAEDIAAAAAAALRSEAFDGQAFSLSGPEALTYGEAAAVISRQAERTITYQNVEDAPFIESLRQAGVPGDYAQFLAALFGFVRQGAASQVTDGVKRLTGRDPIPLEEYAARYAEVWR